MQPLVRKGKRQQVSCFPSQKILFNPRSLRDGCWPTCGSFYRGQYSSPSIPVPEAASQCG
jgi:hypothetical protein